MSRAVNHFLRKEAAAEARETITNDLALHRGDVMPGQTLEDVNQAVKDAQRSARETGVEASRVKESREDDIGRGTVDLKKQDLAEKVGHSREGSIVNEFSPEDLKATMTQGEVLQRHQATVDTNVDQNSPQVQGTPNNEWKGHTVSAAVEKFADKASPEPSHAKEPEPEPER
ncbi:MAG: hypothetical protein AAGG48_17515 [Planctomycetota bacterium]